MRLGLALIVFIFLLLYTYPSVFKKNVFVFPASVQQKKSTLLFNAEVTELKTGSKINLQKILNENPNGVVLNFWATWCAPCLEELPSLELFGRYLAKNKSLPQLVTVSEDDNIQSIPELFKTLDFKPTFFALHDAEGDLAGALGTTKFPETYLISSKGEVLHKWIGPQDWMSEEVLKLISPRG